MNRRSIVIVWIGLSVSTAEASILSYQAATSQVAAAGSTQVRNEVTATDGFASTVAIWPAGVTDVQGRTAARSRETEIAANSRIFSNDFGAGETFGFTLSQAYYAIRIDALPVTSQMDLDFFLPKSYVEVVQNAETYFNTLDTVFFADLRVCRQETCSELERMFHFQAGASGTFRDMQHNILAEGDPSLDFTSLLNPTVTDTGNTMFLRTYLVEFPEYFGHLDLGTFVSGTPFTVEYYLQARTSGVTVLSSAIAAINDPFEVDTDSVTPGAPIVLTINPVSDDVPEPAAGLLVLSGIALFWLMGWISGSAGDLLVDPRTTDSAWPRGSSRLQAVRRRGMSGTSAMS